MTTAPPPAQAAVDRRRCAGLWLSGSPSGLTGIAPLRSSSLGHSRRGADFDVADTLHVRQSKAARRGMPPYLMTELRCSSSLRLTALPTSGWAPGKYIHRLETDFADVAVIGSALRQSLSGT